MTTDTMVHEAHLSTGKTIPLRRTVAQKTGNPYWGILQQLAGGGAKFANYGVNVPVDLLGGEPKAITAITLPAGGVVPKDIKVSCEHDQNEKGKARVKARADFTGADGVKWVFTFRATLVQDGVLNVKSSLNRAGGFQGGGGVRVQGAL